MSLCDTNSLLKVAAVQMCSSDDKWRNLNNVAKLVKRAVLEHQAGLVLLPENFALFDGIDALKLGAEEAKISGDVRRFISDLAKEHSVWIIAGTIPCAVRPDDCLIESRVRSACWVYDDSGREVARYDKIHLFDVDVNDQYGSYRESETFEAGVIPQLVDTPMGKIGLSICYDLRFPKLYSLLVESGAQILSIPAAFTYTTGAAHWEVLLRARAIESQCYVIAANQVGVHSKGRTTWGHSMIINPWGDVIAKIEEGEGVISAEIDLGALDNIRAAMPVLAHRRI